MSLDPTEHRAAYDTMLASLQADLAAWTAAPTVPVDFDPARPYVCTPGGGLTVSFPDGAAKVKVVHLTPDNLVEYSCDEQWAVAFVLGGKDSPWKLVTAIREERIESLTGAIEHLKGYAPPLEGTHDAPHQDVYTDGAL